MTDIVWIALVIAAFVVLYYLDKKRGGE